MSALFTEEWGYDADGFAWLTIGGERPTHHWFDLVDQDHGTDVSLHMERIAQALAEVGYVGGQVTYGVQRPSIWAVDSTGAEVPYVDISRADEVSGLSGLADG